MESEIPSEEDGTTLGKGNCFHNRGSCFQETERGSLHCKLCELANDWDALDIPHCEEEREQGEDEMEEERG